MLTATLQPNREYATRGLERSEEAAIVGEFAAALLDWRPASIPLVEWSLATSRLRVQDWFARRASLLRNYPPAFWFLIRAEAEGIAFLKLTFDELAHERGCSRQCVQQEFEKIMAALTRHEPNVADAVWAYREHHCTSQRPDRQP